MTFSEDLSIGEVACRTGLRPSTLRYYESIGLLPAPLRVNGRRRYDPAAVQMVAVIQLAQHAGFTVAEIQTLFHTTNCTHSAQSRTGATMAVYDRVAFARGLLS